MPNLRCELGPETIGHPVVGNGGQLFQASGTVSLVCIALALAIQPGAERFGRDELCGRLPGFDDNCNLFGRTCFPGPCRWKANERS